MYLVKENLVISDVEESLANGHKGEDLVGIPIVTSNHIGYAMEQLELNSTDFESNVMHVSFYCNLF